MRITYDKDAKPVETEVQNWTLDTDEQGAAEVQIKAEKGGQYRLSYKVTDAKQHEIEGGYVFWSSAKASAPGDFRFNDIELVTDKREYAPGDKVNLLVNTARADSGSSSSCARPTACTRCRRSSTPKARARRR